MLSERPIQRSLMVKLIPCEAQEVNVKSSPVETKEEEEELKTKAQIRKRRGVD